jgi:uncharacterized protein
MELRSMPASTLERVSLEGPAGAIETDVNDPGAPRRGIALVAHPNPLQGGTKDNKVVTTLAKAFFSRGFVALRPNFRGVGASAGPHDGGIGETDDLLAVARYALRRYGPLPVLLAGFSFGAYVQARVAREIAPSDLVLVAPAVNRFEADAVPEETLVVHGEQDDVVPLSAVLGWARTRRLPVVVVPGVGHFFHGRLESLARIVSRWVG